jgi:multiple sugar transport system permease protein
MKQRLFQKLLRFYIPIALFLVVLLFPFYWMVVTTFKSDRELYDLSLNPFYIYTWSLTNVRHLLLETPFLRWLYNTLVVSLTSAFISLGTSLLAAYGIQRIRFRGSGLMGVGIFFCYLVPPTILFIPLATMVFKFRIWDSLMSLSVIYPTFLIPFCTWLLMGYFKSIPKELEECAMMDGAGRLWVFWKVIIPLSLPGILSAGIFAFTLSWNEYLYALTFISSSLKKTVAVGLVTELVRGDVYHWGPLMAGAFLGSVPVALVYSFFVEHYVAGMTGALKE